MRILHLTLKKKWFDMIASGEKKEEYREIKTYWQKRLTREFELGAHYALEGIMKRFDLIIFKNGYAKDAPTLEVEFKGISIGPAVPEWSDNWPCEVFRIHLGEILNHTLPEPMPENNSADK